MKQNPKFPILLIQALLVFSAASSLFTGAGAEEGRAGARAVVLIHDVYELQNMSKDLFGNYELANDIDASDTQNWNDGQGFAPVGTDFTGSLDGRGFTISGLFINRPEELYVGLFNTIHPPSEGVRNLTLASVNVTGNEFVGAIAGNCSGDLTECHVSGVVSGQYHVGGLAGTSVNNNIRWCSFSGKVHGMYILAGGLVGTMRGAILGCYSTGEVEGNDTVGGLVGSCKMGQLHQSFSTANVRGISEVGGCVGANYGNISRCFSTGKVNGTSRVGGFAGYDNNAGSWVGDIRDCFSTGSVRSDTRTGNPGGFIGEAVMTPPDLPYMDYGHIERCYSAGPVSGWPQPGGFMAVNQGATVVDCFWDRETSGCGFSTNGTGKGTSDMMRQATFTNWDFDTIWRIDEGSSYPYLRGMPLSSENNPPAILTAPPTGAFAGRPYSVQFSATDPDGDTLSWAMTSNAGWLSMTAAGLLSGTPAAGDIGTCNVAVTVTDDKGGQASITFELSVLPAPVNHEPVWYSVPSNTTLTEGDDFRSSAAAVDADGDAITYSLTTDPPCALTVNTATGTLEWLNVSVGDYVCALTATDGQATISLSFMLKVGKRPIQPVNRAPEIVNVSAPENRTVKSSETLAFSADATDPDGDNLTYEWKEDNVTLSTEKSFSRRFAPGNHTLVLLIGDGHYVTTRKFNFTVAPPPKAIETKPVSVPGFGAIIAAAAVTVVVATGLFWRRERR